MSVPFEVGRLGCQLPLPFSQFLQLLLEVFECQEISNTAVGWGGCDVLNGNENEFLVSFFSEELVLLTSH